MSVHVYMCVYGCGCILPVCAWVCKPKVTLRCCPSLVTILLVSGDNVSILAWKLLSRLGWLAKEPKGSVCHCPPCTGFLGTVPSRLQKEIILIAFTYSSVCVYMCKPEDNLWELVLPFHHVGPGWAQVVRLSSKCFCPLSHHQPLWLLYIHSEDWAQITVQALCRLT